MILRALLTALGLCLSVQVLSAQTELVTNGNFDTEIPSDDFDFTDSDALDTWHAPVFTDRGIWLSSGGNPGAFFSLDGTAAGRVVLYQGISISDTLSGDLTLNFDLLNSIASNQSVQWGVWAYDTGDTYTFSMGTSTFSGFNSGNQITFGTVTNVAGSGWSSHGPQTVSISAGNDILVVGFILEDPINSASGTLGIDNVSLTTAVPEPASFAALLGLMALASVVSRRRRA